MEYHFQGRDIQADAEGYLLDKDEWSEALMQEIASVMGLTLTVDHLAVVKAVRRYYDEYATTPAMRQLMAMLKKEGLTNLCDSITLAALFPDGAAKSAAKLAGLPKPVKCI